MFSSRRVRSAPRRLRWSPPPVRGGSDACNSPHDPVRCHRPHQLPRRYAWPAGRATRRRERRDGAHGSRQRERSAVMVADCASAGAVEERTAAPRYASWAGGHRQRRRVISHAGIDLRVPWSPYSAVGSPRPGGEPTRDEPQLASSGQLACSPARARNASGQGVSLSVLGAVRAAELRSGSMGSILSNRTRAA